MKKFVFVSLAFFSSYFSFAQDTPAVSDTPMDTTVLNRTTPPPPPPTRQIAQMISARSKDHFLLQFGYTAWSGMPDSINTRGIPRSFNVYFMFDFPFRTSPKLSAAIGAGVSTNNMYFEKTYVDISGRLANRLGFVNVSDTNYFKKFKLLTTYLEVPVEFRYTANPETPNRSLKAAIGVKIGTLVSASTKGKNLLNKAGQNVNAFTQKEKSRRYFNTTRFSATARLGYGVWSLFGTYQLNSFIKEGFGPDVRPITVGLTLSGL
jgi:hypothetical protein